MINCTKRVGVSTYCYGVITLKCIPELPGNSTYHTCGWNLVAINFIKLEQTCDENSIQLVGGKTSAEGQLQICKDKKWREVCDASSDSQALGYIACKQLGYTETGELQ